MGSTSLSDVRIDEPRRHKTPAELVAAHKAKISTSSPNLCTSQTEFGVKPDCGPKVPKADFVYVNRAYVGSSSSVNVGPVEPPTSVIREQYWACSRWPHTQRVLAIAVGVLLGAVIGLTLIMTLRKTEQDLFITRSLTGHSSPG